jgi:hypothetical protein
MGLKLDPVRLLIADDVGIGKTVEALLVARELLDRGEIQRIAVLCPPHLAEQWQVEMASKFHIDAELVLPSTARRLEGARRRLDESLFDLYPFVIVSTDFIKSDKRRHEFLRSAPEFVIVDEAHTCAYGADTGSGRHQRHELVQGLAADAARHLVLVTATPHSGKEDAFRSLLAFLDPAFANLPADLSGPANESHRRRLAGHFVQRRRKDIKHFMAEATEFPERKEVEESYTLSPEYLRLFDRVLTYAREAVLDADGGLHRPRVRWWSALALLRSLASSPAAAAATLRTRAAAADTETADEADEVGRLTVLDLGDDQGAEAMDVAPGAELGDFAEDANRSRERLLAMAREADALRGPKRDLKLEKAIRMVKELLDEGFSPIVFCRFIPTAEYVAEALRAALPRTVDVAAVTGTLPPAEREERVLRLAEGERHVLVCTDCLSEGINLQQHFDAVVHYDLSWNPTRHEQREGRVDRFAQPKDEVRVVTYFGQDNRIDGIVLDVLIRKHKAIRSSLGISVPVPMDTNQVVEAVFEGLLLREQAGGVQQFLPGFEELIRPQKEKLFGEWDSASEREKRSRTMFAQERIRADEVARELAEVRDAIGSEADIQRFMRDAVPPLGGVVRERGGALEVDVSEAAVAVREAAGFAKPIRARFALPTGEGEVYLNRTHPFVEGLAAHILDTALDSDADAIARRCGVIRTRAVQLRTTALLVRCRYHILTKQQGGGAAPLLAEDCRLLAFSGAPQQADWLDDDDARALLSAEPAGNILPEQARAFVQTVVDGLPALTLHLEAMARERGQALLEAHARVRDASRRTGVRYEVEPKLPVDVLGIYVFLPE